MYFFLILKIQIINLIGIDFSYLIDMINHWILIVHESLFER